MSTRDELESTIEKVEGRWDDLDAIGKPPGSVMPSFERMLADVLIAEGWRKKPSREQIARWVWKRRIGPNGDESFDYLLAREARGREGVPQGIWDEADAVLALMDRGQ